MVNVSKFIKNHIPLCVCTLGIAIVGYLGYHAVRWIINKCHKTEKVDQIGQQTINNPSSNSPKPLLNRVSHVDISPEKITMGQGEYVVFHQLPNGEKKKLTKETFEQVYQILTQCSPAAIINRGAETAAEQCANRYELIKAKVKEIDSSLEVVFIPRTLYELIFIRKCIQEDLKHKQICPLLMPMMNTATVDSPLFRGDQSKYEEFLKERSDTIAKRKCWHLCYFGDAGDNEHAGVKDVAYRLNKAIVKAFSPSVGGFTHQDFAAYAEKEIEFLKAHYKKGSEELDRAQKGERIDSIADCSVGGPTKCFAYEIDRGAIKPMGIRDDTDAQMVRDAIALDCSRIAQRSLFLYRGSNFKEDLPLCDTNKDKPYSLSYGTSLFAGCLYDGGATAFHYMRKKPNAYAIPVPFEHLNDSPFYIPTTHTVAQLAGDGEIFHSRTRAWKDFDMKEIRGMNTGGNGHKREHLKSNLSKDEFTAQFQRYKDNAIHLK